jgi:hypothetical protein
MLAALSFWRMHLSPKPNRERSTTIATAMLTGKLTGNFAKTGHPPYVSGLIGTQIQWLATEFPAQRDREFPNAYQGIFFKEQRI